MSDISMTGESREVALLRIVSAIGFAEGKMVNTGGMYFKTGGYSREWLLQTFAVARECLDGPAKKPTPEGV